MNLFHRYVIRELVAPFVFAFSVIMFILILKLMLQLMDILITSGVDPLVMLKLLVYNLAWMVALVVPMSVLVATLMAFGRLGAAGEITAMKSAGISMYRVVSPVFLLAVLITLIMIWFNNDVLPEANHRAGSLTSAIKMKKPMFSLRNREGQFIKDLPGLTIKVNRIDYATEEMHGVTLFRQEGTDFRTTIVAERGHFELYPTGDRMALVLEHGQVHVPQPEADRYIRNTFTEFRQIIRVNFGLDTNYQAQKNDRRKTPEELKADIAKGRRTIEESKRRLATIPKDSPNFEAMTKNLELYIALEQTAVNEALVELYKKSSIPVGAMVFVLIGAALGILVRRSGASIGIGMSIGFFTLYYLFLIGGETLGDRQLVSPWLAMWMPNIFFGIVGVALMIHANRR